MKKKEGIQDSKYAQNVQSQPDQPILQSAMDPIRQVTTTGSKVVKGVDVNPKGQIWKSGSSQTETQST